MNQAAKLGYIVRQVLFLTYKYLLASVAIAFFLLVVQYGSKFLDALDSESNVPSGSSQQSLAHLTSVALKPVNELSFAPALSSMIFWGAVGLLVYLVFLFVADFYKATKDQAKSDKIRHTSMGNRYFFSHITNKMLAMFVLIIFMFSTALFLIDYWFSYFDIYINGGLRAADFGYVVLGFLFLTLNIYALLVAAYFTWSYEKSIL